MSTGSSLWKADEARMRVGTEVSPDPLTYKAFLSEYEGGRKRGIEEVEQNSFSPESAAMNLEMGDVVQAAQEVIDLMKRIVLSANRGAVKVQPQRFAAKLSGHLSKLVYNLGRCEGYREAGRLKYGSDD